MDDARPPKRGFNFGLQTIASPSAVLIFLFRAFKFGIQAVFYEQAAASRPSALLL
jgi:hypothetical protein